MNNETQHSPDRIPAPSFWLWRWARLLFIPTVVDQAREVKWWQYVNRYGICMTKVVDLSSGWTAESNCIPERAVTDAHIAELVAFLRSPPNDRNEPRVE